MPISPCQYRSSIGSHQNNIYSRHEGGASGSARIKKGSSISEILEVRNGGRNIMFEADRVLNTSKRLNGTNAFRRNPVSTALQIMCLCSQARIEGPIPPSAEEGSLSRSGNNPLYAISDFVSAVSQSAVAATASFIAHDPLPLIPGAYAAPSSRSDSGIVRHMDSDSYIVSGVQAKEELISSLVKYLVSDGQLTEAEGEALKSKMRVEAAEMPMLVARLDNEAQPIKRTSESARNKAIEDHITKHCAFEEEVLNAQGENQGKVLLFQAQRADHPFRFIYDNTDGGPSPEARGVADGLWWVAAIITFGLTPAIGGMVASSKRHEYYKNKGDGICAERYSRLLVAQVVTAADIDGLPYTSRGASGKPRFTEFRNVLPTRKDAAFYTRDPHSGIRRELLLKLKQGEGSIDDGGREVYIRPTERAGEFVTYHPDAVNPKLLERRVIVDENDLTWRYADSLDSTGLNVRIEAGKRQIELYGEYYELNQNGAGKYEIVLPKKSGITEYVPVYMEPLSRVWHMSTRNERRVFSDEQQKIIDKIKVNGDVRLDAYYILPNNNPSYYGSGELIDVQAGSIQGKFIEMGGEYIPVRNTQHKVRGALYEAYDVKNPDAQGYPIEWDGERWLFESETSIHVSEFLEQQVAADMLAENVNAEMLSAPDHMGLRVDEGGGKYIKVKGKYLKVDGSEDLPFITMGDGSKKYIEFKGGEFHSVGESGGVRGEADVRYMNPQGAQSSRMDAGGSAGVRKLNKINEFIDPEILESNLSENRVNEVVDGLLGEYLEGHEYQTYRGLSVDAVRDPTYVVNMKREYELHAQGALNHAEEALRRLGGEEYEGEVQWVQDYLAGALGVRDPNVVSAAYRELHTATVAIRDYMRDAASDGYNNFVIACAPQIKVDALAYKSPLSDVQLKKVPTAFTIVRDPEHRIYLIGDRLQPAPPLGSPHESVAPVGQVILHEASHTSIQTEDFYYANWTPPRGMAGPRRPNALEMKNKFDAAVESGEIMNNEFVREFMVTRVIAGLPYLPRAFHPSDESMMWQDPENPYRVRQESRQGAVVKVHCDEGHSESHQPRAARGQP